MCDIDFRLSKQCIKVHKIFCSCPVNCLENVTVLGYVNINGFEDEDFMENVLSLGQYISCFIIMLQF